jgi:hypothetical protein
VNTAPNPRDNPAKSKTNETSFGKTCRNGMLKNVQVQTEAIATQIKAPNKVQWPNVGPVSSQKKAGQGKKNETRAPTLHAM